MKDLKIQATLSYRKTQQLKLCKNIDTNEPPKDAGSMKKLRENSNFLLLWPLALYEGEYVLLSKFWYIPIVR